MQLSVLDQSVCVEGRGEDDALRDTVSLAAHAESLGYARFWVSEHHGLPTIVGTAPEVLMAAIAARTARIRIGSAGVMLPHYSAYKVAEVFRALDALAPGRIDLGLGRAPGTDGATWRALRRDPSAAERFPDDVVELQALLGPVQPGQRVRAIPGAGSNLPLWILGSSLYGAQVAAHFGLPYAFASHFAPAALDHALTVYRERFRPSPQLERPYAIAAANVVAADNDIEARRLFTSQQQRVTDMLRNARSTLPPPIDDINQYWSPAERIQAMRMLECSIVGSPETVTQGLEAFIARTGADEIIATGMIFDHAARVHSFEILAEAAKRAHASRSTRPSGSTAHQAAAVAA